MVSRHRETCAIRRQNFCIAKIPLTIQCCVKTAADMLWTLFHNVLYQTILSGTSISCDARSNSAKARDRAIRDPSADRFTMRHRYLGPAYSAYLTTRLPRPLLAGTTVLLLPERGMGRLRSVSEVLAIVRQLALLCGVGAALSLRAVAINLVSGGWEMWSRSAARRKFNSSATATKYRRCRSSII